MNILKKFDAWLGTLPSRNLSPLPPELALQIHEIKEALGRKGYLLDKYILMLFRGFGTHLTWEIAEDGFNLFGRLRGLCITALDGKAVDDPFYGHVAAYIQSHPLAYDSRYTKSQIYALRLAEDFMRMAVPEALQEYRQEIGNKMDIILLDSLYKEMAEYCDEERLELLIKAILKQYIVVDFANLLLQGFLSHLVYSLTDRDDESGRECFLLLMDEDKPA